VFFERRMPYNIAKEDKEIMDQAKIGGFLKLLRKEKELTQEQLAEQFYVSSRTVSRWETGSNMPDLSVLIELADFYRVDIREILDGERKNSNMDKELKDTLNKVADYSREDKKRMGRRMSVLFLLGIIGNIIWALIVEFGDLPQDSDYLEGSGSRFRSRFRLRDADNRLPHGVRNHG
jgi:transcriptional regulator with XRE-family HTH domain